MLFFLPSVWQKFSCGMTWAITSWYWTSATKQRLRGCWERPESLATFINPARQKPWLQGTQNVIVADFLGQSLHQWSKFSYKILIVSIQFTFVLVPLQSWSPLQKSLVSPSEVVSVVMFISGVGVIIYCDVRLQTRGRRHTEGDRYKLQVCSHPEHGKLNCLDFIPHSQPRDSNPGWIHWETTDICYLRGSASAPSLGLDLGLLALGHPERDRCEV